MVRQLTDFFFPVEIKLFGFELIFAFKKVSTAFECMGCSAKANQEISNILRKS